MTVIPNFYLLKFRRVPIGSCSGRDIFSNDASRTDQGVFSHINAAQDGHRTTNTCTFTNGRSLQFPIRIGLHAAVGIRGPGMPVVDKGHVVANEHIVLDHHALADKTMG